MVAKHQTSIHRGYVSWVTCLNNTMTIRFFVAAIAAHRTRRPLQSWSITPIVMSVGTQRLAGLAGGLMKRAHRQTGVAGTRCPRTTSALLTISILFVAAASRAAPAAPPAPFATPATPPSPAPVPAQEPAETAVEDAPNLVVPDDTPEGQVDPFVKIAELEARLDQMQSLVAGRQPRVVV